MVCYQFLFILRLSLEITFLGAPTENISGLSVEDSQCNGNSQWLFKASRITSGVHGGGSGMALVVTPLVT